MASVLFRRDESEKLLPSSSSYQLCFPFIPLWGMIVMLQVTT